jgi:hypothetical protein
MTIIKIARPRIRADRSSDSRVADRISDARAQVRLSVTAIIRTTETITVGSSPAYRCELSDGSGEINLIFLGRATVPGFHAGRYCVAEGMVGTYGGMLTMWNPKYQLMPAAHELEL